jgi:preprotein translocase subunit SecY
MKDRSWFGREIAVPLLLMAALAVFLRLGLALPANAAVGRFGAHAADVDSDSLWERLARVFQLNAFGILALCLTPIFLARKILPTIPWLRIDEEEGEFGRLRIEWMARIVAIALATLTSLIVNLQLLGAAGLREVGVPSFLHLVVSQVVGFMLLLRISDFVDEHGFGGGESMVWFVWTAGVIARSTADIGVEHGTTGVAVALLLCLMLVPVTVVAAMATHRVPIQSPRRAPTIRRMSGQNTYIPIVLHPFLNAVAGSWTLVVAVSALLSIAGLPDLVTNLDRDGWFSIWGAIIAVIWILVSAVKAPLSSTFDPEEISETIRRKGGFIPGVRPGEPTTSYLAKAQSRLAVVAVLTLGFWLYVLPLVIADAIVGEMRGFDLLLTSLLPAALLSISIWRSIRVEFVMHDYEGFLS